ncbi:unnamed protein product [Brassica rapa subsp. narinosa]
MGEGRVVIAGSVNNDFEPLEKLTDRPSDGMGPWAERAGVDGPLVVGGSGRVQSHTKPQSLTYRTHKTTKSNLYNTRPSHTFNLAFLLLHKLPTEKT